MAELAHSVHGPRDGPVVLLVHGFPFDGRMWRFQIGPLTAAGYRVVVPDLAGFGRSEEGRFTTMEEAALDILALLDRLHVERVVPVGFSMGGYVALALAALAPKRLAGLAFVDTRAEADSEEGRAKRDQAIAQVQAHGPRTLAMAMLANQLSEAARRDQRLLAEEVRDMMLRQPKAAVAAALQAMRDRPDRRDLLRGLHVPCLVLVGEKDTVTPPAAAQVLADLSRGELRTIPGAAHLTPMEAPDEVNDALLAWLPRTHA